MTTSFFVKPVRVVNVRACVRAVVQRVLQCLGKRISHLRRTDRGVCGCFSALEVDRNLVGFENSFFSPSSSSLSGLGLLCVKDKPSAESMTGERRTATFLYLLHCTCGGVRDHDGGV